MILSKNNIVCYLHATLRVHSKFACQHIKAKIKGKSYRMSKTKFNVSFDKAHFHSFIRFLRERSCNKVLIGQDPEHFTDIRDKVSLAFKLLTALNALFIPAKFCGVFQWSKNLVSVYRDAGILKWIGKRTKHFFSSTFDATRDHWACLVWVNECEPVKAILTSNMAALGLISINVFKFCKRSAIDGNLHDQFSWSSPYIPEVGSLARLSTQSRIRFKGRLASGWIREQFSEKQTAHWLKPRTVMGMLKQESSTAHSDKRSPIWPYFQLNSPSNSSTSPPSCCWFRAFCARHEVPVPTIQKYDSLLTVSRF